MALTSPDNIWTPDSSDNYALTTDLAATADSIQDAITALRGNNAPTVRVANVAERNAALADHGTPTTSNPLIVFRADAGAGRELEYTTNGSLWHTLAAEEDTGWLSITPGPLYAGSDLYVCQAGRRVSFFGQATRTSGSPGDTSNETIGYLPAAISRPQWSQAQPGMGTNANVGKVGIRTDGEIFVAGAVTGGGYIRLDAVHYTTYL